MSMVVLIYGSEVYRYYIIHMGRAMGKEENNCAVESTARSFRWRSSPQKLFHRYNGAQEFTVLTTAIFKPLTTGEIWRKLTGRTETE